GRDLYSISPNATRTVACCYSRPPSGLHHLGSIPRQSPPPRSEPDQQRGSRWAYSRGALFAARRVALWHLRAASEYTLYRQRRSLPELLLQLEKSGRTAASPLHVLAGKAAG